MQAVLTTFFNPILPVFFIFLVGAVLARRGMFDASAAQAINRFVFLVSLPALLFSLLSEASLEQLDWRVLGLYYLSEVILVAWLLFVSVAQISRFWQDPALLVAAGPCGSMPFVLALQYRIESATIGRAILYSTVASLFTLALIG